MELLQHTFVRQLLSLGLPSADYVVAGSGPLLAHGLRESVGDLDVVARGRAWKAVLELGEPVVPPSGHGSVVLLFDGNIEVFDRWLPGAPGPDELIAGAETIEGVPFCPLRTVLGWKERSGRDKDRDDVRLIRSYLLRYSA